MKRRLFAYTTLVVFIGLLSFFVLSLSVVRNANVNSAKNTAIKTAQICAAFFNSNTNLYDFYVCGVEIEIILADDVENHENYPEIEAALFGAPKAFVRGGTVYYAVQANFGDDYVILRTAVPVAGINSYFMPMLPFMGLVFLLSAALCFVLARKITTGVIVPIKQALQKFALFPNNSQAETNVKIYEEIDKLTKEIDSSATAMQRHFSALRDEKNELSYIINNMGGGLFVVDDANTITLINSAAMDIFGVTPDVVGKNLNYLCYDEALSLAISEREKNAVLEIVLKGSIFFVTVKRLPNASFTMIAMADVTENRENSKRREEFFANASHELKTPLTAIKGFNELLLLNSNDGSLRKYADSIARETNRMLLLIEDMLSLSELESIKGSGHARMPVQVGDIIAEAGESLSSAITEKNIDFKITGNGVVLAEPGHVYEVAKNLIENAVRYNNQNGKVHVAISRKRGVLQLVVADNGIGVSPSEQVRIFERFYRVEKSRAPKGGGTGLGLSIVKHICSLYGWDVSLKSKLGVGTEVTVVFGR